MVNYDDALRKSLEEFFCYNITEPPAECIYRHIAALVAIEYYVQKHSSLDKTYLPLDRLMTALGHEKISDQLNIFQLINCARLLEYLKSPELSTKRIEGVEDFILLVEDRKQGNIDSDKFSRDATTYIEQIRQVIPKQSLAWLLLDKIVVCVALILLPIAIANGVYHKAMNGKFRLGFFDAQTPENKHINHIEVLFNQRPDRPPSPIVA